MLTPTQIDDFIHQGFVKIENAFPEEVAAECRTILWKETGCDPNDPATWTKPVIRIAELKQEPFKIAANTPLLRRAYDQLVGKDNWLPRETMGSFPIRFPSKEPANDTGWHVDASFPGEDVHNYFEWRINVHSKARGLLMLFLFSEVSASDAPTLLKVGSHLDVARILQPEGETGLSFMELSGRLNSIPTREEAIATGKAGTVFLCHPFLVHAAQQHRGTTPKFMAQPPLFTKRDFMLRETEAPVSPVEEAIRLGLSH